MTRDRRLPLVLCCGFALLYLASIRPSETWGGGDFALYMMHAQNLLHGRAYAATNFLFNPANAIMSPAAYPPGYPLLLAPVLALFGPSLRAAAGLSALLMTANLWLLYRLARPALGQRWSLLLLLAAGCSPVLANHRDAVESDLAFLTCCLLALLALREGWATALFLAVLMAPLTRTIGFVLPAALALPLLWQAWRGRPDPSGMRHLGVILAATGLALAVSWAMRADSGTYLGYFARVPPGALPAHLASTALAYLTALVALFGLSFGRLANAALLLPLLAAIGWGVARALRRGLSATECFLGLYAAVLLVYPVHSEPVRYALPVLPLLLLYALDGMRAARLPLPLAAAALLACYAPFYWVHNPLAAPPHAYDSPASRGLRDAVAALPADAIILAGNPRAVALLTGHRAVAWPEQPSAGNLRATAEQFHAGYLLITAADAQDALAPGTAPLYQNPDFRLWRLTPAAAPGR